jgi:hypothetical protein
VLFSGAIAIQAIFGLDLLWGIWIIAALAGVYGGLKAVVWSDLFQGSALLLGGVIITVLGFRAIGGWTPFVESAGARLSTVLPWNHPEMPWVAVFIEEPGRGTARHHARRVHQTPHPVHHRFSRHHGRHALSRADRARGRGVSGARARAAPGRAARVHVRRVTRRGGQHARQPPRATTCGWAGSQRSASPRSLPVRTDIVLESSPSVRVLGVILIGMTAALYLMFW